MPGCAGKLQRELPSLIMVYSCFFSVHDCITECTCHGEASTGLGVALSWGCGVVCCLPAWDVCVLFWPTKLCCLTWPCLAIVVSGLPLCELNHEDVKFIQAEQDELNFISFTLAQVVYRESLIPDSTVNTALCYPSQLLLDEPALSAIVPALKFG